MKAEYPGGMQELMKFLISELTYPQEALENNIQGTVIVEFIVCKDGTVCNANILKSVHESLDNEAVRVAELMGKWTPGKIDGENVATYFQLPVMYKLPSKGKAKRKR